VPAAQLEGVLAHGVVAGGRGAVGVGRLDRLPPEELEPPDEVADGSLREAEVMREVGHGVSFLPAPEQGDAKGDGGRRHGADSLKGRWP
jgi:hypothetical protein